MKIGELSIVYGIVALLSALLWSAYLLFDKKKNRLFMILFGCITLSNGGYFLLSVCHSLNVAKLANGLSYFGGSYAAGSGSLQQRWGRNYHSPQDNNRTPDDHGSGNHRAPARTEPQETTAPADDLPGELVETTFWSLRYDPEVWVWEYEDALHDSDYESSLYLMIPDPEDPEYGLTYFSDLFGTDYPWPCDACVMEDGSILVIMTDERPDESADELIVFKLTGF